MTDNKPFPNPEGKINVLKRYLHILALLQYTPGDKKTEIWNANKLADLLSKDETGKPLEDTQIRKYIRDHIKKELEIDIDSAQGKPSMFLAEDLDMETQLMVARVYSGFVVKDSTRDIVLKRFIAAMPGRALWTLARIYFAVIEKRMIRINYITNAGYKINRWKLCPYYLVFRNNNLYLVAWDPAGEKHIPLLAERIKKLDVLDKSESHDWDIIPAEELFKDSLSAYLTEGKPVEVKIRYSKTIQNIIENIIYILDPQIKSVESGDWFESTFSLTDYRYLCKQLVFYGKDVEILSPPVVRQAMTDMLEECLTVYKK